MIIETVTVGEEYTHVFRHDMVVVQGVETVQGMVTVTVAGRLGEVEQIGGDSFAANYMESMDYARMAGGMHSRGWTGVETSAVAFVGFMTWAVAFCHAFNIA